MMNCRAQPRSKSSIHDYPRGPFRCVVFDFDDTLSLLRGDWQGIMVPQMVETLLATKSGESQEA